MTRATHDFRYDILDDVGHRPWPLPSAPWIMTQTWHDVLFAHWEVDRDVLLPRIPTQCELDLFEGRAWLGIVAFEMTNVAPRMVPALPWLSAFPEINVRTYVRANDKPGVYFFSLDATNAVAVLAARTLFHLPYFAASIALRRSEADVDYRSERASGAAVFHARYRPAGAASAPGPGTLEHFLTERYCLYTVDGASRLRRLEIHHPPWPLQRAEADVHLNTLAQADGFALPAARPLLHFSKRQDVVNWGLQLA